MCRRIHQTGRAFFRRDHQLGGHWIKSIQPRADLKHICAAFDDFCSPPHGHDPPSVLGCREKLPIADIETRRRIGHIVRCHREAFDRKTCLPRCQRLSLRLEHAGFGDCVLIDQYLLHVDASPSFCFSLPQTRGLEPPIDNDVTPQKSRRI